MIIDCDTCVMRDTDACTDCVVTAVLEPSTGPLIFDGDEVVAITLLQDSGLLPPSHFTPAKDAADVLAGPMSGERLGRGQGLREDRGRAGAGGLHG
jgi:hypothetical protein